MQTLTNKQILEFILYLGYYLSDLCIYEEESLPLINDCCVALLKASKSLTLINMLRTFNLYESWISLSREKSDRNKLDADVDMMTSQENQPQPS